jgi:uncharacterized membrane protein
MGLSHLLVQNDVCANGSVVWVVRPQEGDTLTANDLMTDYPKLIPL